MMGKESTWHHLKNQQNIQHPPSYLITYALAELGFRAGEKAETWILQLHIA